MITDRRDFFCRLAALPLNGASAALLNKPPGAHAVSEQALADTNLSALANAARTAPSYLVPGSTTVQQDRTPEQRFNDYINVNDLSDGSGSVANDQAAITAAVALTVVSKPHAKILYTRPFSMNAEVQVTAPCTMEMLARGAERAPLIGTYLTGIGPMRSMFNILTDHVTLTNMFAAGQGNFDQALDFTKPALNCTTGPDAFIRVDKDSGYYGKTAGPITITGLRAYGFPYIVDWVSGVRPNFFDFFSEKCGVALNFRNGGTDGVVGPISANYGAAIDIKQTTGTSATSQMEGTCFYSIRCALTRSPAFGYTFPGIWVQGGYALRFFDPQPQEVYLADAFCLDGRSHAIINIEIHALYCDCGAGNDSNKSNLNGLSVLGHCDGVRVFGMNGNNFSGSAIRIAGTNDKTTVSRFLVSGFWGIGNKNDLVSLNCIGAVQGCSFLNVVEGHNSTIIGYANDFQLPPKLSLTSRWRGSTNATTTGGSLGASCVASGSTQSTATQITSESVVVTSVPRGSGVILPPYSLGLLGNQSCEIINAGANPLTVYPYTGMAIWQLGVVSTSSLPVNTGVTLQPSTKSTYILSSVTQVYEVS